MIPEEVDRDFTSVILISCLLDSCLSLMVKAVQEINDGWVHVVGLAFFSEEAVPLALNEAEKYPLFKKLLLD